MLFLRTFPSRLKNYHAINVPPIAKPILGLMRSVLSTKMKARLIIHNDVRGLKNYLDDFFSVDYAGKLCQDDFSAAWQNYYLENQPWKQKAKKLRLRGEVPKEKGRAMF